MAGTYDLYNAGVGWSNWSEIAKTGNASVTDGASSVTITATEDSSHTLHRSAVFDATNWDYLKADVVIHGVEKTFSINLSEVSGNHRAEISTYCESDYGVQDWVSLYLYTEAGSQVDSDGNYGFNGTTDVEITRVWLEGYSTGWKSPGTVVSDSSVGTIAWSNPSNAAASDNVYATVTPSYEDSEYLRATNFGFEIPAGATIDGILVEVEWKATRNEDLAYENVVKIVKADGSIGSANKSTGAILPTTDTYSSFGGSADLWSETWSSSDINDEDFGVVLSVNSGDDTVSVDHIQIKVYYTESSGTEADSERGLYISGYSTSNSTRGLYLQGSLASNSTRGLYIEGFVDTLYSRESSASLKADDSNLSTMFSERDYTDVATDDDAYVDLEGTAQYFQLLFKEPNTNRNNTDDFKVTWKGKSSLAPSSSAVYLQIYNRTTESWTTLVSNSSANADTEFTLEDTVNTDLSDYYDENYIISVRVYQDGVV